MRSDRYARQRVRDRNAADTLFFLPTCPRKECAKLCGRDDVRCPKCGARLFLDDFYNPPPGKWLPIL